MRKGDTKVSPFCCTPFSARLEGEHSVTRQNQETTLRSNGPRCSTDPILRVLWPVNHRLAIGAKERLHVAEVDVEHELARLDFSLFADGVREHPEPKHRLGAELFELRVDHVFPLPDVRRRLHVLRVREHVANDLIQLLAVRVIPGNALEVRGPNEQVFHAVETAGEICDAALLGGSVHLLALVPVCAGQARSQRTAHALDEGGHAVCAKEKKLHYDARDAIENDHESLLWAMGFGTVVREIARSRTGKEL